jgi:hypothetical protein
MAGCTPVRGAVDAAIDKIAGVLEGGVKVTQGRPVVLAIAVTVPAGVIQGDIHCLIVPEYITGEVPLPATIVVGVKHGIRYLGHVAHTHGGIYAAGTVVLVAGGAVGG